RLSNFGINSTVRADRIRSRPRVTLCGLQRILTHVVGADPRRRCELSLQLVLKSDVALGSRRDLISRAISVGIGLDSRPWTGSVAYWTFPVSAAVFSEQFH